jgi:hypothetical protein
MTQVYFNCSNTNEVLIDRRRMVVDDLAEARDHAACRRAFLRLPRTASPRAWAGGFEPPYGWNQNQATFLYLSTRILKNYRNSPLYRSIG